MNTKSQAAIAALLLTGAASVSAQVGPVRPQYEFPATPVQEGMGAVRIGDSGFFLAPAVTAAFGQDDNLFLSNNSPKRTMFHMLNPSLRVDARDPTKVFQMNYGANIGRYLSSSADNYVDHSLRTSFDMLVTRQAAFRAGFDYLKGHDPRGSTDRAIAGSPDKYDLSTPSIIVSYGQPGAVARVEGLVSETRKRYKNNRASTLTADRDNTDYGLAGFFRVMPRTQLLAEYRKTELDYTSFNNPLSGEEERIYGGVTWKATAATSGTIKVGTLRKKFDNGLPSFSGSSWEGLITWEPRTYSKFDFYSYRQPVESSGVGSFILSEATGVVWSHAWNSFVSTEVNAKFQRDKYQGASRSDDITGVGLKAAYKFRRWLQFGAEYQFSNRDSSAPNTDYDRNLWILSATATL